MLVPARLRTPACQRRSSGGSWRDSRQSPLSGSRSRAQFAATSLKAAAMGGSRGRPAGGLRGRRDRFAAAASAFLLVLGGGGRVVLGPILRQMLSRALRR